MKSNSIFKTLFTIVTIMVLVLVLGCEEDDSSRRFGKTIVSFSDETYRIVESSTDDIRIPIGLDNPYHSGGTVDVTITGGVPGEDYTVNQPSNTFTISFSRTSVTEYFSITPIDDNRLNQDVELEIVLSNPTGGLELGLVSFLQVILLDDEVRMDAEVGFVPMEYQVTENDTLAIDLSFSNLSTDGGTINIVAGGGDAIYGEDYIIEGANDSAEITLSVEEYGESASFNIIALDNDIFEENKSFNLQILEVSGGIEIDSENSIVEVTIIEDDPSPFAIIGFDASNDTTVEESANQITLNLNLSQALANDEEISVTLNPSSTATLGDDFTFLEGSVTNPYVLNLVAGAESAEIILQIIDDELEETEETIELSLSTMSQTLNIDENASTFSLSINDNDTDGGGGQTSELYLETFESFDGEETDFLIEQLGFQRIILTGQTMPDSEVITLINNAGNFADVDNIGGTSDDGLNAFTNTQNDTSLPVDGTVDNVLITPAIEGADGDLIFNVDINYAFKNQNSGVVTFYYSDTYTGSGDWDPSQWTELGSETVADLDAEGFGNNSFKREEFNANATGTIYFAIRLTSQLSEANYRFRFRFDNIKITSN